MRGLMQRHKNTHPVSDRLEMVRKLSDEVGLLKNAQFAVIYESDHEVGGACRGDALSTNTHAGALKTTPGAGLQFIELTSTKNAVGKGAKIRVEISKSPWRCVTLWHAADYAYLSNPCKPRRRFQPCPGT